MNICWHEYYISWCVSLYVRYIEPHRWNASRVNLFTIKKKICFRYTHPQAIKVLANLFLHKNRFGESLKLKTSKFVLQTQLFTSQDFNSSCVDYYDVFISCLDSHSDGTHSLQRIHWNSFKKPHWIEYNHLHKHDFTNNLRKFIHLGIHKWVTLFIWKDQEKMYMIF